jgi:hypothetical protein
VTDENDRRPDVTSTAAPPHLTASDRCDRCGARAYLRVVLPGGGELLFCAHHLRVVLPGGGELLFCAHHGRAHESALRAVEAEILDETEALTGTPGTAPLDER